MRFLISIDLDDRSMVCESMLGFLSSVPNLEFSCGASKTKVEAINADMDKLGDYDILVLMSDDMIPVARGYDEIMVEHMAKAFPMLNGCLHFDDGYNKNGLNTLPIMGRAMVEKWKHVYHPSYHSLFSDQEFQDVSERDGISHKIDRCIVRHEWVGHIHQDALCRHNETFDKLDRANYHARKAAGFPP